MIQISSRERLLAIGLIAALTAWVGWTKMIEPARQRIRTLEKIIPEKHAQLRELTATSSEYTALQNEFKGLRTKLASQKADFQLGPFLETMIDRHKLAGHATMQSDIVQGTPNAIFRVGEPQPQPDYSETVVTIDLQDITLRQLIALLTAVEASDAVIQINSLHIRRDATNEALIDSTVAFYNPRLAPTSTRLAQTP